MADDTLRDRIAMAALTGLLANPELAKASVGVPSTTDAYARDAYRFADAMLEWGKPQPKKEVRRG